MTISQYAGGAVAAEGLETRRATYDPMLDAISAGPREFYERVAAKGVDDDVRLEWQIRIRKALHAKVAELERRLERDPSSPEPREQLADHLWLLARLKPLPLPLGGQRRLH
jgi:hypothetical protein